MNLQEKFAALPPEIQEKFLAVKDEAGLDALLKEAEIELSVEEKEQVLALYVAGAAPLQDYELENVAGGCGGSTKKCECGSTKIYTEMTIDSNHHWLVTRCSRCHAVLARRVHHLPR
jgi:hypothetical protein